MVIGCYFIGVIGGYSWLLVPILLVANNRYFIGGYQCPLMVILLMVINGYSINDH